MQKLAAVLLVVALSGCFSFLQDEEEERLPRGDPGYDAGMVGITEVQVHDVTFLGFDNTTLSGVVYEPITPDALPDGSKPHWPVILLLHGWGFTKETFQNLPLEGRPVDLMDRYANAGFLVVAYDARGMGQSGGFVTAAGPAEQEDLRRVIDQVLGSFDTTGDVGLAGLSYGAGQGYLALDDERIRAYALHQGWTDLAEAVMPGGVPKLEWAELLFALGGGASQGRMHPQLWDWYEQFYTREAIARVQAEMDQRSVLRLRSQVPIYACQGMQDTLIPQTLTVLKEAPGFTRGRIHEGGHASIDATCWANTLDWFRFFLQGIDNGVESWPKLTTVDARGGTPVSYQDLTTAPTTWFLRDGVLAEGPSDARATVRQQLAFNPLQEPSVVQDLIGGPPSALPSELRRDPAGVFFAGTPFDGARVLLGAPTLHLTINQTDVPMQIAATLYVESGGRSQLLTRGAGALYEANVTLEIRLEPIKADLLPGDRLVLKVAANDPGMYMPLFANYETVFTGGSRLVVPFFAP